MLREAEEAVLVNATPKWCKREEQASGQPGRLPYAPTPYSRFPIPHSR